ncbi:G protein-coupled glucose receptor regulating Gpa2-domain-containing protein [Dipodascopsis uninucleata]
MISSVTDKLLFERFVTGTQSTYSEHDAEGIRIISLIASFMSIFSCLLAFYWYFRMESKVFRHTLIMLLIFSDFGRAIILMWYPIRLWYTGGNSIGPHGCQADGFFAALSIEAADYAVLVIALHTVAFIMFPQVGSSSAYIYGGLYRYRKPIYVGWFLIPSTLAALAFVKTGDVGNGADYTSSNLGYIQLSTWCYLPVRPIWYRLVLTWVPRYLVLMTICVIYIGLYIYVARVLRQVGDVISQTDELRHRQVREAEQDIQVHSQNQIQRASSIQGLQPQCRTQSILQTSSRYYAGSSRVDAIETNTQPSRHLRGATTYDDQTSVMNDGATFEPSLPRYVNTSDMNHDAHNKQAAAIERQVKYLLLYPIFYVIVWTAPFVSQIMNYSYYYSQHPVVWLGYITAFMYGISGFLNTIIFAIRETPWRRRKSRMQSQMRKDDIRSSSFFVAHSRRLSSSSADMALSVDEGATKKRKLQQKWNAFTTRTATMFGYKGSLFTKQCDTETNSPSGTPPRKILTTVSTVDPLNFNTMNDVHLGRRSDKESGDSASLFISTSLSTPTFSNSKMSRPINSPYDIMKIDRKRPADTDKPSAGGSEWWERLESLECSDRLRKYNLSEEDNCELASEEYFYEYPLIDDGYGDDIYDSNDDRRPSSSSSSLTSSIILQPNFVRSDSAVEGATKLQSVQEE